MKPNSAPEADFLQVPTSSFDLHPCFQQAGRRGIALVFTLAILVLLTGIILAFFSQATLHRQISFTSSGQNRAELLSHTAMDTIVADLRAEIAAGSGSAGLIGSSPVYIPDSNQTVVPFRTVVNDPTLANLVKVSGSVLWSGSNYAPPVSGTNITPPVRVAPGNAVLTTTPSLGGRFIPNEIWNMPLLLGTGTSVPSQFPVPSWILLTRQGPIADATNLPPMPQLRDHSPGNNNYVIGRYAFALYDEGGLIDVNVAGNTLSASASYDPNAQRGRLHQAALGQIPLTSDTNSGSPANVAAANSLVKWRSSNATPQWLFSGTNTFLQVSGSGDQAFVTRQDLIQHFQKSLTLKDASGQPLYPNGLSLNALQYLGVFSRELNQPSFTPAPLTTAVFPAQPGPGTRPKLQAASGSYGLGNPNLPPGLDDKFNPSLVNARLPDGTPVFKQRFPLSRLAWITSNGPSANLPSTDPTIKQLIKLGVSQQTINEGTDGSNGSKDNIRTYFGLAWDQNNHVWVYTSPEGVGLTGTNIINPLGNIPSTRTTGPDFFETLMASIAIGSLGRDSGPAYTGTGTVGSASDVMAWDQNVYRHILQIGANIIDQARPDDLPAAYKILTTGNNANLVFGVKNLPYLTRLNLLLLTDYTNYAAKDVQSRGYLAPEVWNPHQQTNLTSGPRPTSFRIRACFDPDNPRASGASNITIFNNSPKNQQTTTTSDLCAENPIVFDYSSVPAVTPTLLTATNSRGGSAWSAANPRAVTPDPVYFKNAQWWSFLSTTQTQKLYGFYCGSYSNKLSTSGTSKAPKFAGGIPISYQIYIRPANQNSFIMEYTTDGANWYPYAAIRNIVSYWEPYVGAYASDSQAPSYDSESGGLGMDLHIDPRTDRFGMIGRYSNDGYSSYEYSPFVSQTLYHCPIPPPTPSLSAWADARYVGESTWFSSYANDGNGGTNDNAKGGAFHLQSTCAICAAGLQTGAGRPGNGKYLESIADNLGPYSASGPSANYYYDPDGIVRPAAGAYISGSSADGHPMAMSPAFLTPPTTAVSTNFQMNTSSTAGLSSQPVLLNRPYRSVAELGYVFRDVPWKDIDFFTTTTGDAALLDAFSIDDTTIAISGSSMALASGTLPVVAGKINLNTQNLLTIQAMLMGAARDNISTTGSNQISQADAKNLATQLISRTGTNAAGMGPLTSKADLVRFAGDINSSNTPAAPDRIIKARREAAIRALSDAGNVRTWNLMIDVIVQAGKYSSSAKTVDQFTVEGEKHYWLHLALDRYTGQVVDALLEPVYE